MGIAMCSFAGLLVPIQRLIRASFGLRARHGHAVAAGSGKTCMHTAAGRAHVAWPASRRPGAGRPLRVLRVVDAGYAPSSAGRMVISGRMADVCAELDRLAALEGAAA